MNETAQEQAVTHSQEPWAIADEPEYDELEMTDAEGNIVGYFNMVPRTDSFPGCGTPEPRKNAERVIACVNELKDINPKAVPKLFKAVGRAISRMENIRDGHIEDMALRSPDLTILSELLHAITVAGSES